MSAPDPELSCQELVELVTAYFDGALDPAEQRRFEAHVSECPGCTEYLGQMRATLGMVGDTAALAARPELGALLAAFRGYHRA